VRRLSGTIPWLYFSSLLKRYRPGVLSTCTVDRDLSEEEARVINAILCEGCRLGSTLRGWFEILQDGTTGVSGRGERLGGELRWHVKAYSDHGGLQVVARHVVVLGSASSAHRSELVYEEGCRCFDIRGPNLDYQFRIDDHGGSVGEPASVGVISLRRCAWT
jgi:hypothetical protein